MCCLYCVVVCWLLFEVSCSLFVVCDVPRVVRGLLFVDCCFLCLRLLFVVWGFVVFVVRCLQVAVSCLLFAVCCLLFAVCCLLFVLCCLLLVVLCWLFVILALVVCCLVFWCSFFCYVFSGVGYSSFIVCLRLFVAGRCVLFVVFSLLLRVACCL